MAKNPSIYYVVMLAVGLLFGCNSEEKRSPPMLSLEECSSYKKMNFDSLLNLIQKQMPIELDVNEQFLLNKSFAEIFEHGTCYVDDAVHTLKEESITKDRAGICLLAMQNISVDDYLKIGDAYLELFTKDKIPEPMLQTYLFPGILDKNILLDNYDNRDVIALLTRIKKNSKVSKASREMIESVLEGR
jgi:hypothetical protein